VGFHAVTLSISHRILGPNKCSFRATVELFGITAWRRSGVRSTQGKLECCHQSLAPFTLCVVDQAIVSGVKPSCAPQMPWVYSPDIKEDRKMQRCAAYSSECDLKAPHNPSIPLCSRPTVLFYGAIESSFMGKRVKMCNVRLRLIRP
jgi:hypothetical protein